MIDVSATIGKFWWTFVAVCMMVFSGVFLYLAQKTIPIGTAYAIWTGIGAGGIFLAGILLFHDVLTFVRGLSVCLIIVGVIVLKLSH